MDSLAFLLAAGMLIFIGSMVLWLRERKPATMESGIEEFSREMKALAPERGTSAEGPPRRRSARPGGRPAPGEG